jgi:hypothetical protein
MNSLFIRLRSCFLGASKVYRICIGFVMGQSALARQELERVLRIDPNYSGATEVKKQLAQLKS